MTPHLPAVVVVDDAADVRADDIVGAHGGGACYEPAKRAFVVRLRGAFDA